MTVEHLSEAVGGTVGLPCVSCGKGLQVERSVTRFCCSSCGADNFIYACARCEGPEIVSSRGKGPPAGWTCGWCYQEHQLSMLRRSYGTPSRTAAEVRAAREDHRLTSGGKDVALLGGFTLVAGSGDCPPVDAICSIVGLEEGILVTAEHGAAGRSMLRYDDLLGVEVGGHGSITTGRQWAGGGLGITGAVKGMALASVLNAASKRTTVVDSFLRITSRETEMFFSHPRCLPGAVRNTFSAMFVRIETARRAGPSKPSGSSGPLDELERLARLHDAGALTDSEFELARAPYVQKLISQDR